MATKKPIKLPKKEDIVLAVKYCVELPDKVLHEVLSLGCAKKLDQFGQSFAGCLEKIKKAGNISKEVLGQFSDIVKALAATTVVLDIIEDTWSDKKGCCNEKCKELTGKKEEKPDCKKAKKQTAGGILTKEEMANIKSLRKTGMSIKAIGKSIKRGEKVVANYVHELENTPKRK